MKLTKSESLGDLYGFYRNMLTDIQQQYFEDYYFNDLSLAEIADNYQVSRQAVYDNLKRTSMSLEEYESKLHLMQHYLNMDHSLTQALSLLQDKKYTQVKEVLTNLEKKLQEE